MDHKSFDLTAPYIHDHSDSRCYRPDIVPDKRKLEVCVPAPPDQRMLVERNPNPALSEMGFNQKVSLYNKESIRVNRQREANVYAAHKSELHETIYGQARIIEKPILYPQNLSHDMALSLENKAGPCLPYDQRPPTKEVRTPHRPFAYLHICPGRSKHRVTPHRPITPRPRLPTTTAPNTAGHGAAHEHEDVHAVLTYSDQGRAHVREGRGLLFVATAKQLCRSLFS